MDLGQDIAFAYSSFVLFPETFLHLHQARGGKTRQLAEQSFMEVVADHEERLCLEQDINEAAERMLREKEEGRDPDSEEEWIDHSDLEDDE